MDDTKPVPVLLRITFTVLRGGNYKTDLAKIILIVYITPSEECHARDIGTPLNYSLKINKLQTMPLLLFNTFIHFHLYILVSLEPVKFFQYIYVKRGKTSSVMKGER